MNTRIATQSDAQTISELCIELGYPAQSEQIENRLQQILNSKNDMILVAEKEDGIICGWIQVQTSNVIEYGYRAEIVGLIVATQARRTGVGNLLVQAAENWARQQGSEIIQVRSNIKREASHAFYPALGFEQIKSQHVYRKSIN